MNTQNQNIVILKGILWGFVGLVVLLIFSGFYTIIPAGERGVVLKLGAVNRVLSDGFHFKIAMVEKVKKLDVKTQKEQVSATAASKDLQNVTTVVALNYNLEPDKVGELWKTIGEDYKVRIIDPAIQEAIKAATAKYTAEELITKRELVRDEIKTTLVARLQKEFIQTTEVSIVDFRFSEAFDSAIELKVTAEQNALASKNKLEQTKYEAEQRIAQAKGEAEAIRIQSQAIQAEGGAEYVQLQAIKQWKGDVPTYMMGNAVPFINLNR